MTPATKAGRRISLPNGLLTADATVQDVLAIEAEASADLDRLRAERDALAEDEQSAQEDLDRLRATPLNVDRLAQAMTKCAPTRLGVYAEAEAIAHEYNAGDRSAERPAPLDEDRLAKALPNWNPSLIAQIARKYAAALGDRAAEEPCGDCMKVRPFECPRHAAEDDA